VIIMAPPCCVELTQRLLEEFTNLLDATLADGGAIPEVWADFGAWCHRIVVTHMRHHIN
jgi:hypothetical protein